ncbi:Asd/ArgC dimerization domain-containing protein [Tunturiibacter empetritectus]|uniref:Aspartate-semialdehyde dehydrogenase n=1 Tax=Tunturiibacter lichenicola TaxID=2051959 RepID=A0A852VHS5_9BACT|nr:Asd/ArgC dimerization domain-containing protein [Edaphobacter lichenicola]NYF90741.1 aspartate-semialdehyde dehydrogenase [Edaphobacter lichenicola]
MAEQIYRIGIVGASSLAGKELSEELGESLLGASDFVLLDEEEAVGQVTAAGDEVAFIQRLEATSFERMDFVFFAGDAAVTKKHWQMARRAGASIVDLTYALDGEKDVLVRAPWVTEVLADTAALASPEPDLNTPALVAAHPGAVMLALVAGRLHTKLALKSVAATVMEPASEYGRAAMDELHQQTVTLLSFQTLPREQYDAQVAFNLLPTLGEAAKVKLSATEERIRRHYAGLADSLLPQLALQLVQAPVFHGYVVSMLVEFSTEATKEEIEAALGGEHIDVISEESDPPSNLSAAGQEDIMVRVSGDSGEGERGRRFWLWLSADNLKLAALNAIACGAELRRLRPRGKVQ